MPPPAVSSVTCASSRASPASTAAFPTTSQRRLHRLPATRQATPQPGAAGPHWGRLSLLDRIGKGTSCEVYRAWDTALHREVALKLLHDEGDHTQAHARLLDEARRLARVRHAHVVQVYGAEQHDNRVGLWMELVRGDSLEQTVQARGRSVRARPPSSGSICARPSPRSTAPACCTATSRPRTSCARAAAASC